MHPHRLGEMLVSAGRVTDKQLTIALKLQEESEERLGAILVAGGSCKNADVREVLGKQQVTETVDLTNTDISGDIRDLLHSDLVRMYEVVPLSAADELHVAAVSPHCGMMRDAVVAATGYSAVKVSLATSADFANYVSRQYECPTLLSSALESAKEIDIEIETHERDGENSPANHPIGSALFNFAIGELLRRRAYELHIDPVAPSSIARLRIAGSLVPLYVAPSRLHAPVVEHLESSMALQGGNGSVTITVSGHTDYFQVSTLDALHGKAVVVRRQTAERCTLDELDLASSSLQRLKATLSATSGLIVVTGPPNSGLSTTARALVRHFDQPSRHVVAIERNSNVLGGGALQICVSSAGSAIAAFRRALSQDPDVIMVDATDEPEVLHEAAAQAMSGHIVIATDWSGRAIECLVRLNSMASPHYLVPNSTLCVVAQRLCQRVCEGCAKSHTLTAEVLKEFGLTPKLVSNASPRKGSGCIACDDTGYTGVVSIYELLFVRSPIQEALRGGKGSEAILKCARDDGYYTLWEDGIAKVLQGATTFDELRAAMALD